MPKKSALTFSDSFGERYVGHLHVASDFWHGHVLPLSPFRSGCTCSGGRRLPSSHPLCDRLQDDAGRKVRFGRRLGLPTAWWHVMLPVRLCGRPRCARKPAFLKPPIFPRRSALIADACWRTRSKSAASSRCLFASIPSSQPAGGHYSQVVVICPIATSTRMIPSLRSRLPRQRRGS